jgi:hypothetical protein
VAWAISYTVAAATGAAECAVSKTARAASYHMTTAISTAIMSTLATAFAFMTATNFSAVVTAPEKCF